MSGRFFLVALCGIAASCATAPDPAPTSQAGAGRYRIPYADGTQVRIFDSFATHRPVGRIDMFGVEGQRPYRVVAAAAGVVMAIQDGFSEQQTGRAAAECRNNYVWIAHPNGEWTNYSHLAHNSATRSAGLSVGDRVAQGAYLGDEAAVGCAQLDHLHFEVAIPAPGRPIDAGGFLTDNEGGRREREPRFCGVRGAMMKDATYRARRC